MDDLISRQAAIDVIDKEQKEIDVSDVSAMYAYSKCKTIIKQLPSVPSTDCISRQMAIEALKEAFNPNIAGFVKVKIVIEQLPPAEPKRGKWLPADSLYHGAPFYYCSECGEKVLDTVMEKPRWNFCPMCGAKMEGADDE